MATNYYLFPGGTQVIDVSRWLTSNAGQAVQYVARSSRLDGKFKVDDVQTRIADLDKAIDFLKDEKARLGHDAGGC